MRVHRKPFGPDATATVTAWAPPHRFGYALTAMEAMRRQLGAELGGRGIRVVTLHTGGVLERLPEDFEDRDMITEMIVAPTMLKRAATPRRRR